MDQQTVQDVAERIFEVETTPAPADESPMQDFERHFANPARNPFRNWNPLSTTIRGYQLRDAIVPGSFLGLWNQDGFLGGTNYIRRPDELSRIGVTEGNIVDRAEDSTVAIGCNQVHHNYFHWVTQALPTIDHALGRIDRDRDVVLALPVLNAWQEESLRLLGHDRVPRVTLDDPEKFYRFRKVEYSELLRGGASFKPSLVTGRTYRRLRRAVPRLRLDGRRLYVARTDTTRRPLVNESAVIDELRRRGFEILEPGSLSIRDQIRTFREASLVVGPHGAGMTNIVFCEPGTIVYELLPAYYTNACFAALGLTCRLRYWTDGFASQLSDDTNYGDRPWDLDMDQLRWRLDEIERIQRM